MPGERRQFSRVRHPLEVRCRLALESGEGWRPGLTADLSASGIRFLCQTAFEAEDHVALEVFLPGEPGPIALQGRVIRSRMLPSGEWETAAEFADVSADQRRQLDEMIRFLNRRV
jgi:c-di-GMP-binding flagellar brake protein YcgR